MGRLEGFIFGYPGLYSLTVPYHDSNDFFYSGHVGTCLLVVLEYRSAGFYKLSYFALFVLANQWLMLCLVRTHYIIDLVTGITAAHYMFMLAERASFVVDVKLLRIASKKRFSACFKFCNNCGWSNRYAGDFMSEEEKYIIKELETDQRNQGIGMNVKAEDIDTEKVSKIRRVGEKPFASARVG
jgi:hypothetical protein